MDDPAPGRVVRGWREHLTTLARCSREVSTSAPRGSAVGVSDSGQQPETSDEEPVTTEGGRAEDIDAESQASGDAGNAD